MASKRKKDAKDSDSKKKIKLALNESNDSEQFKFKIILDDPMTFRTFVSIANSLLLQTTFTLKELEHKSLPQPYCLINVVNPEKNCYIRGQVAVTTDSNVSSKNSKEDHRFTISSELFCAAISGCSVKNAACITIPLTEEKVVITSVDSFVSESSSEVPLIDETGDTDTLKIPDVEFNVILDMQIGDLKNVISKVEKMAKTIRFLFRDKIIKEQVTIDSSPVSAAPMDDTSVFQLDQKDVKHTDMKHTDVKHTDTNFANQPKQKIKYTRHCCLQIDAHDISKGRFKRVFRATSESLVDPDKSNEEALDLLQQVPVIMRLSETGQNTNAKALKEMEKSMTTVFECNFPVTYLSKIFSKMDVTNITLKFIKSEEGSPPAFIRCVIDETTNSFVELILSQIENE